MSEPSKSQVRQAGKRLRAFSAPAADLTFDDQVLVADAFEVLNAWRRAHATPLNAATMGLRSLCRTAGCQAEISQRLKRVPTILDKLRREPTLALERMQDIGGARAVLPTIEDVRTVQARYSSLGSRLLRTSDYIETPRASGYRGVHLIVSYHGHTIEIQLRTMLMHEWAVIVEQISGRLGANLKQDGTHPVQLLLAAASRAMALEEQGVVADDEFLAAFARLRANAAPFLRGGGRQ